MKNKLWIIALTAIIGFSFAACGDGSGNNNGGTETGTAPTITTNSLPNGTVNTAYSQTLQATGDSPITWSINTGTLPTGLTLNAETGVIAGTPTTATSSTFTVKATNAVGNVTKQFSITISAGGLSTLSGNVTIVQTTGITTGMVMYARYSGTETVSYQWKNGSTNVGTNSNMFTPTTAGSYTVTVSATGYNSKESGVVSVTTLASGYEIMYWGVIPSSDVNYLKESDQETLYDEFEAGRLKQDTINKSTPKSITFSGSGYWCVIVPRNLGLLTIKDAMGNDVTSIFPAINVTFHGIDYYMHISNTNAGQTGLVLNLSY